MKCYKCVAEVADNVSLCHKCGEKLVEESLSLDEVVKSIKEDNKDGLNLNTGKPEETYKEFIFHLLAYLSLIGGVLLGFSGLSAGCLGFVSSFKYNEAKRFKSQYIIGIIFGIIWIILIAWVIANI